MLRLCRAESWSFGSSRFSSGGPRLAPSLFVSIRLASTTRRAESWSFGSFRFSSARPRVAPSLLVSIRLASTTRRVESWSFGSSRFSSGGPRVAPLVLVVYSLGLRRPYSVPFREASIHLVPFRSFSPDVHRSRGRRRLEGRHRRWRDWVHGWKLPCR